jgi:UDP-glucose 4-epimerase
MGEAHGLRWIALLYFNAAGCDPEGEIGENHTPETHLIPLALQATLDSRRPVRIFGTDYATDDGTAVRDYLHVTDLARAHVLALEYLEGNGPSRAFNLGTGRGYSVRQILECVAQVTGRKPAYAEGGRRRGDPPVLVAAAGRAQIALGWTPRFSDLATIIETAWNWQTAE